MGGGQWSGKTTAARLLAAHFGLIHYAYDYHDARAHTARALADPGRYPLTAASRSPAPDFETWVRWSPEELAYEARRVFSERFDMALHDLAALPAGATVVAEGWGLRPRLVAPLLRSPRQAVFLVPTDGWVERQQRELPRASRFFAEVSDPERAQRNRITRDQLLAGEVARDATRLGLKVVPVDGTRGEAEIAEEVGTHLAPHLPRWIYDEVAPHH